MAQIENNGQPVRRAGVRRMKKAHPRTDMTPMVDLGFLLITFFVFTTTINTPQETTLVVPKTGPVDSLTTAGESTTLTVLLNENDRLTYYHGKWETSIATGALKETNFDYQTGLGQVIRNKQIALDHNPRITGGRKELFLIIKPGKHSSYKNLVDVLDEVMINKVKKYALVDISDPEEDFLASH